MLQQLFQQTHASILVPAHFALAIWVTAHALLHKREVGSALGWIGLAWLAPFVGGILYFVAGINRVKRRALRLKRRPKTRAAGPAGSERGLDEDLLPLQRSIARISKRRLEHGNRLTTYQNGDEAYPEMLSAIESARTTIGLSSYIFRKDVWGRRFIHALTEAHARGVEVRVILDGVGGGWLYSGAFNALRKAGVPAGRFLHSPLPWRMPLLNLRSHKKILVVDGTVGFTGGMNIADENVMATHPAHPVEDTHFKVAGPVVSQLVDAFVDDWSFVMGEELDGPHWFPVVPADGSAKARVITSGPDQDIEKIEVTLLQAIACARASVYVMTPYFLPDDKVMSALALAAMRGVTVHIVIPERSNHWYVDHATRANLGSMLKDGVNVWLGPPPFRHSKAMIVDGEWALIGSSNWDMRSLRLNFELCMEVYDEAFAQSLQHFVTSHRGEPLTNAQLKERALPIQLRDAALRLMMPYL